MAVHHTVELHESKRTVTLPCPRKNDTSKTQCKRCDHGAGFV
jgi:hypothetical protein